MIVIKIIVIKNDCNKNDCNKNKPADSKSKQDIFMRFLVNSFTCYKIEINNFRLLQPL